MGDETDHRVFRTKQAVQFERRCANAVPHQVQAYAELRSEDRCARALVLVYARRDSVRPHEVVVGARLVAMRLETTNAGVQWSVSLEAHTQGGHHLGTRHSHYICCPSRAERRWRTFRTDRTGVLEWLDYPEPLGKYWRSGYPRNWSPNMETTASILGVTDESRDVALELVLTKSEDGSAVRLRGPGIRIPDRIWYKRRPKSKIWGRFASLDPYGRFALWRTILRAVLYWGCVTERRNAKRNFSVR